MASDTHPATVPRNAPEERDMAALLSALWRRRVLLVACVAGGVLLALGQRALAPERYTATVTILPQENEPQGTAMLGALAVQAGIPLSLGGGNEEAYGRILTSRLVLGPQIERTWNHRDFADAVTLYDVFGIAPGGDEASERAARDRVLRILREDVVGFQRDALTGFMVLSVTVPRDPQLAAALANELVAALENFNDHVRENKARTQREMIERRLDEVEAELRAASDAVTTFIENNRAYLSSPSLSQEHTRLQRVASAHALVWQELQRQLELARIDELRNAVTVDVLDDAEPPVRPDRPGVVFVAILGALLGFVVALTIMAAQAVAGVLRNAHGGN